jgi:hypothetical protein
VVSRYSDEEREAALALARELIKHSPERYEPPPRRAERTTSRDEPFVPDYCEPARLDTPPVPPAPIDWNAVIDRKIDDALGVR